jgi:predicted RNase H-like nuclease (RuvC/YqgF family)
MIKIDKNTKKQLIDLQESKNISLEGNILKLIDTSEDPDFEKYIKDSIEKDRESRKKRLEITKKIQDQNKNLTELNSENERINSEIKCALEEMEESKIQIEEQNKELIEWREENERITQELHKALSSAEEAKKLAENDLDLLQKKTQFELIGTIVRISLFVIIGVGVITTSVYMVALFLGKDTEIIASTWSNMFGILLTNSFSIIGTIMGVKYAASTKKEEEN